MIRSCLCRFHHCTTQFLPGEQVLDIRSPIPQHDTLLRTIRQQPTCHARADRLQLTFVESWSGLDIESRTGMHLGDRTQESMTGWTLTAIHLFPTPHKLCLRSVCPGTQM